MALLVPNEGKVALADYLNSGGSLAAASIGLYKNTPTIDQDLILSDITECDFSGYGSQTPSFAAATLVSNKGSIVASPANDFVHDSGGTANTVNGYFVFDSGLSVCLWIEAFASPIIMTADGDTISVTAKLTVDTE